ncbi:TetR/AcrR family transcriptional regulator [Mycolicibacterium sp. Dal123E01]|uniref:TetR/AcrR family transcriptional regulator n=1 Tax=Mycolicibacterium sp. Dal123E01 TaxID=3457578 RepID=UPI00403E8550
MRADAKKNYEQLLAVAESVIAEQGVDASLRDIARRADVGLATLFRHFPTREAMLEALLRAQFDEMTARAVELETSASPADALVSWLHDFIAYAHKYRGVVAAMMNAIEDPQSALHTSCVTMRTAGTRLLNRAQSAGMARTDVDGTDLFALASSLAWLGDQAAVAERLDHLSDVVASAILTSAHRNDGALGEQS